MIPRLHGPREVVIVGGGFGGLRAAQYLAKVPVRVTLLDRRNFHLFQPLLYQVATGALSPANIAAPLRAVLKQQVNCRVLLAEVVDFDLKHRRVILKDGETAYDALVVATGARHHYFGHEEWESLAPGLKTIEDATEIRRRFLFAFEAAEREPNPEKRKEWLTFVVVGGGPTGVELAGAMREIACDTFKQNFRSFDPGEARIFLVEGADRVLPPYPPELSAKAELALKRLGVTFLPNAVVTAVSPDGVVITRGEAVERIATRAVFWGAGVKASPLARKLADASGAVADRMGRVMVEPDLSLPGYADVFVLGDMAHCPDKTGTPLPAVAQVAMQQGKYVANVLAARVAGLPPPPAFKYADLGMMATIGRHAAVAQIGKYKLSGYFAWLIWLFVHLMNLIQFQNRFLVLSQWAWNYWTKNRSARLITGGTREEG